MILATLVDKVRRKINDWFGGDAAQQKYTDEYYNDASDDAVGRLNHDLETSYTISSIPTTLEWVLVLLTTIEMCIIRQNEEEGEEEAGTLKSFDVDGLSTEHYEGKSMRAQDWQDLCSQLEDKYEDFLEESAPKDSESLRLPSVGIITANRNHLRRGRALRHYSLDKGVAAPAIVLAQTVAGIVITWSAIFNFQFSNYQIQRKLSTEDWDNDASSIVTVATIYDNHTERHVDVAATTPATYNYRMKLTNRGGVKKYSAEQTVTVV